MSRSAFTILLGCVLVCSAALSDDNLERGEGIKRGEERTSTNGNVKLRMDSAGRVSLECSGVKTWEPTDKTGDLFVLQDDQNLVFYDNGQVLFATNTEQKAANVLVVQDDGNLVLYAGAVALWASNTTCNPPAPAGKVRMYEHGDKGGRSVELQLTKGIDDLGAAEYGIKDEISSVEIDDSDALVFLWEEISREGRALVLNQPGMRNMPDGWNDTIASVGTYRCPMELKDALKIKNLFEWARLSELQHVKDQIYDLKATREADKAAEWAKDKLPGNESSCNWESLEIFAKEGRAKGRMKVRIKHDFGKLIGTVQDTEYFEFEYSVNDRPTVVWEKHFKIAGYDVGEMRVDVVEMLAAAGML